MTRGHWLPSLNRPEMYGLVNTLHIQKLIRKRIGTGRPLITHTFAFTTFSPLSEKTKSASNMYRKVFISIIENRCPIHDYKDPARRVSFRHHGTI